MAEQLAEFLRAEHPRLLRTAYLMTGSQHAAEDLAQEAMVMVVVRWKRVERSDRPQAYVRRLLLNLYLADRRRRWSGETATDPAQLSSPAEPDATNRIDDRDALLAQLRQLPPRQRAAVVLRHYEQHTEAQTAHLMGCSIGTVKSLTSRGLAALRAQDKSVQEKT